MFVRLCINQSIGVTLKYPYEVTLLYSTMDCGTVIGPNRYDIFNDILVGWGSEATLLPAENNTNSYLKMNIPYSFNRSNATNTV